MLPAVTLCGCGITANGWNTEGVKLYEAGHLTQAIERFQYALGTNDQNSDAYYNLAVTYHQMGLQSKDQGFLKESEALYNRCLTLKQIIRIAIADSLSFWHKPTDRKRRFPC